MGAVFFLVNALSLTGFTDLWEIFTSWISITVSSGSLTIRGLGRLVLKFCQLKKDKLRKA